MLEGKKIAVVIPSYNVEHLIAKVITTLPDFVDHAVVVNDASKDNTESAVLELNEEKVVYIKHVRNGGVGAAIGTGYKWCRDNKIDVTAVMAGDGQMDPKELQRVVEPVLRNIADYSKGNRLFFQDSFARIPKIRFFGNSMLSLLTKAASGYWHSADSQTGYTAINLEALETIDLDDIYPRYGVPNDILVKLNIHDFRVIDVPVQPIYNIGEKSGIKVRKVVFTISVLLIRLFFKRMLLKYIIKDFHPLVLFYTLGFVCLPLGILLGMFFFFYSIVAHVNIPTGWLILSVMLCLSGFQSLFFAMWFDMDYNRHLYVFYNRRNDKSGII